MVRAGERLSPGPRARADGALRSLEGTLAGSGSPRGGGALARRARAASAGALLGGVAAALGWGWRYGLAGAGTAALGSAHAVLALALGGLLASAGLRGPRAFAAGLAAALALAGVAPALLERADDASAAPSGVPRELARAEALGRPAARVAIVGLDGGDWSVIDPMIAAGELPTLAALASRGRTAVLHSIEPMQSPLLWTSIFSGRTPEAHGITGWSRSHSANRRVGVLWEMAGAAGLPSIVVNVPGTWPPTEARGALVSGFPIPAPLRHAGRDPRLAQNLATIVAEGERDGPLYTAVARPAGGGALHAMASLGGWLAPLPPGPRHFAIEAAIRRGWLPIPQVEIALARSAQARLGLAAWTVNGRTVELPRGGWSPWLATPSPAGPLHLRLRRLSDGALFVTPAFQDPAAPVHPYASSREVQDVVAGLGLYVVEPAGWRSAADPGVRDAVFEHLLDVEEMHVRASLALRAWRPDWRLFAHVITLTDRASHAFWRFHRPADYPPIDPGELEVHGDKVARAYRESDRLLGQLLEGLGPDTAVIVLSDHGFASAGEQWGDHRSEGVLVAAGPGLAPGAERLSLSIYDVAPLALALLGLPVADDFEARPPSAMLAPGVPVRAIATWESPSDAGAPRARTTIDETTEEQLRGLGYVE